MSDDCSDGDGDHEQLLRNVATIGFSKRKKPKVRTAASDGSQGNERVPTLGLLPHLEGLANVGELKKQLKVARQRTKVLNPPLHRQANEKVQRIAAYQQVTEDLTKWDAVIHKNRLSDQLVFPLNQVPYQMKTAAEACKRSKPRTELEIRTADILKGSDHVLSNDVELTVAEQKILKAMSLKEAKERRAALQKMRALVSYQEAKMKRQKKIKSKGYHRILKKQKRRTLLKEFELLQEKDPKAAAEKLELLDKDRVEERVTLKHRSSGKWARQMRSFAKHDPKAKQFVDEQLRLGQELKQKVVHLSDSSSDEDDCNSAKPAGKRDDAGGEGERDEDDDDDGSLTFFDSSNPWMRSTLHQMRQADRVDTGAVMSTDYKQLRKSQKDDHSVEAQLTGTEELNGSDAGAASTSREVLDTVDTDSVSAPAYNLRTRKKKPGDAAAHCGDNESPDAGGRQSGAKASTKRRSEAISSNIPGEHSEDDGDINTQVSDSKKGSGAGSDTGAAPSEDITVDPETGADTGTVDVESKQKPKKKRKRGKGKRKNQNGGPDNRVLLEMSIDDILPSDDDDDDDDNDKMNKIARRQRNQKEKRKGSGGTTSYGSGSIGCQGPRHMAAPQSVGPNCTAGAAGGLVNAALLKTTPISNAMPQVVELLGGADDSDDCADDQQAALIAEAFADDDILDDFAKEKKSIEERDKPNDIDLSLPGWGDWAGPGIRPNPARRKRFIVKAPDAPPRKDRFMPGVIISESECKAIKKLQVDDVPFPFKSVAEYEASLSHPLGREWNTETAHARLTEPAVVMKRGAVISPMDKELTFHSSKRKEIEGQNDLTG